LESRQESDEYDVPRSIPIKCFCFITPCPRVVATVARPGVVWQQVLHRRVPESHSSLIISPPARQQQTRRGSNVMGQRSGPNLELRKGYTHPIPPSEDPDLPVRAAGPGRVEERRNSPTASIPGHTRPIPRSDHGHSLLPTAGEPAAGCEGATPRRTITLGKTGPAFCAGLLEPGT
jgi:hypothetical protein